jgi:hypothetical protein
VKLIAIASVSTKSVTAPIAEIAPNAIKPELPPDVTAAVRRSPVASVSITVPSDVATSDKS